MHLLILGMNYAPEVTGIAPYTAGLAEYLVRNGHRVTVATTFPHYPQWRVQEPYAGAWRTVERQAGVEVRRGRVILPGKRSAAGRIAYDSSLALGALVNALTLPRADAVLCVSPPIQLGLTGALLARRWRAPLALLVKDLPLDAALAVGMMRPGRAYRAGRRLEALAYNLAQRVVVISEGFRQSLLRQGVPAAKLVKIPDWSNVDQIRPQPADPELRARLGASEGDFLILHTGNMGEKQGLANALAAVSRGRAERRPKLALVGDGSDRAALEAIVAREGLANVRFLPLQPAEVFPRLLASADALLLNQRANVIDSVAPSKLLSYMAAGRPVLAAVHGDSEAAAVVREAHCGLIVPPEDPEALAAATAELAGNVPLRVVLGASGRAHAEEHFARGRVLARYEAFLVNLVDPASGVIRESPV